MFKFREVEKHFDAEDRIKKVNIATTTIKPKSGITMQEARNFWDNLFTQISEEEP